MGTIISVDCGRSGVKGVSEHERLYFRAALGAHRELRNGRELGIDEFDVLYKAERYFIGRIAAEESEDGTQMMTAYKAHTDTKILTLTAIHRLTHPDARVTLITGLPLKYHIESDKQRMRELLTGEHELTVNGVKKRFTIERVEVAAEGAAAAWHIGRTRRDRFHVVDIGSRTVNYVTMLNGRWIDKDSDSLDYGFETFRGTEAQFARVLIADLGRLLRPLGPIVLVGGKETLAAHLQTYQDKIEIHPDALFANAVAFREMGVTINAKSKAASR
ncbi:ParM/StbA family protein [Alicyclobacillus fodiniaquatilis]|uniref:ParM/StbA family protein n=1 Tax=Alicyclobacillus fodiniaquatilis TaxID=1661150 RepID=A0ABW4JI32_9BACL